MKRECSLDIDRNNWPIECDGCGVMIAVGSPIVGNIESCCGQCARNLCTDCVKQAYALVMKFEQEQAAT
jgi:hypothetical protein